MSEHDDIWLRQQVVAEHRKAIEEEARHNQRASDLVLLANALDGFYTHPNTLEEDKRAFNEALKRLLLGGAL